MSSEVWQVGADLCEKRQTMGAEVISFCIDGKGWEIAPAGATEITADDISSPNWQRSFDPAAYERLTLTRADGAVSLHAFARRIRKTT